MHFGAFGIKIDFKQNWSAILGMNFVQASDDEDHGLHLDDWK